MKFGENWQVKSKLKETLIKIQKGKKNSLVKYTKKKIE